MKDLYNFKTRLSLHQDLSEAAYLSKLISFLYAVRVFFISMATVIGPTPPGTGVMKLAFSFTPKMFK